MKNYTPYYLYLPILLYISGCSNLFEFSPYDTPASSRHLNYSSAELIQKNHVPKDTFRLAVFSDPHSYYDDLYGAIKSINKQSGLNFVICAGDITEAGLAQEFQWYWDIAGTCRYPVVTAIGNHDYRSNGISLFKRWFGDTNYSFVAGKYRFILFDDIVWENNNTSPNFDWLKNTLADSLHYNIIITHIPPWTDQLEGPYSAKFNGLITQSNTMFVIHGHLHSHSQLKYKGVHTLIPGSVSEKGYNIIALVKDTAFVTRVNF